MSSESSRKVRVINALEQKISLTFAQVMAIIISCTVHEYRV